MKKTRLLLVVAAFAFAYSSCQKSDSTAPAQNDQQTYNVQFNVQNFQASYSDMSPNKISVAGLSPQGGSASLANAIVYLVYDSLGNLVNSQQQLKYGNPNFGVIADKLKAGLYTFVIGAASKDTSFLYPTSRFTDLKVYCDADYYTEGGQDIFLFKQNIRINKSDTSFNNIQPTRLTGKLVINFTDTIPASYKRMDVSLDSVPAYYHVASGSVGWKQHQAHSFYPSFSSGLVYYALGNQILNVRVDGLKQTNPDVIDRSISIKNVNIYTNKQTILTGKFFDVQSVGIPITIDTSYSGSININF
ncbi:hypothetical protein [Pinibacter aurantiacus]|uniref:FimB/Mfa2 family fimbrial subunit n=1 Tax=Pinibacter aurantiacus TaxID=2851599 RepID=A0A9E2S8D8_9BACT|nr:hypothetical protein [Pinibacter aurantiacus]MBV4356797.1 hypothetical protein [Pinibacter aurantiacus]